MAGDRPTRWQAAKQDWSGIRVKREAVISIIGGALGAGMLLILGFPGASVEHVITVIAAAVAAAVLVPTAELAWAWLQAPMRLLTADVVAVRERVERLVADDLPAPNSPPSPPPNLRLAVLEFARRGDAFRRGSYLATERESWAREVTTFLTEYATEEETEFWLEQSEIFEQVNALREIAEARRG